MSLSLTGRFQSEGHVCLRGYHLWASDVNSAGGLLSRPVRLVVLNDKSNPNVAETRLAFSNSTANRPDGLPGSDPNDVLR